jgi:metal-responsive CopG/Arc/MetJ family transcriptional regulator
MEMRRKTERLPFMCEKNLLDEIDNYSYSNRIRTRAEAIRRLIKVGLQAAAPETQKGEVTA